MGLTRKALSAMGIESEKVDQIIELHAETVNAIKAERDTAKEEAEKYKAEADKLPGVQKELDKLKEEADKAGSAQKKYEDLKAEFDKYKDDQTAAKKKADITAAARAYFKEKNITSEDNLEIVMRGCRDEIGALELGEDGKIKDTKALDDLVSGVYAKFVTTEGIKGANTATPPANNGGTVNQPSRAAQLAQQYNSEHYGSKEE